MDISNVAFLFYFLPVFLAIYYLVPKKGKIYISLIGSLIFYGWIAGWVVVLLTGLVLIDYWLVDGMKEVEHRKRKLYLISSIILNLTPLLYYKYLGSTGEMNFTLQSSLLIPIGIGFYTLQKIAYAVDVYRKQSLHLESFIDYAFYILFFPKLIAGPFVQLESFGKQIKQIGENETIDNFLNGCTRFSIGLAKKILIANTVASFVGEVFNNTGDISTSVAWVGLIAFSVQIFFDYSGYVDMAIGISLMLGFKLPESFNDPYVSTSVSNFWRNWNITFYHWMKTYLFIPLGGNKKRVLLNILIVNLIAGFWYGVSYTFLLFALYSSLFLILERIGISRILEKLGRIPASIYTFFIVLFGWGILRSSSLVELVDLVKNLMGLTIETVEIDLSRKQSFVILFGLMIIFMPLVVSWKGAKKQLSQRVNPSIYLLVRSVLAILLLIISISHIISEEFVPFIHTNF